VRVSREDATKAGRRAQAGALTGIIWHVSSRLQVVDIRSQNAILRLYLASCTLVPARDETVSSVKLPANDAPSRALSQSALYQAKPRHRYRGTLDCCCSLCPLPLPSPTSPGFQPFSPAKLLSIKQTVTIWPRLVNRILNDLRSLLPHRRYSIHYSTFSTLH
jgi:hypothetical protein